MKVPMCALFGWLAFSIPVCGAPLVVAEITLTAARDGGGEDILRFPLVQVESGVSAIVALGELEYEFTPTVVEADMVTVGGELRQRKGAEVELLSRHQIVAQLGQPCSIDVGRYGLTLRLTNRE